MVIDRISLECSMCVISCAMDEEEKAIMRRLKQYGIKGTGRKSIDKAKLHDIELREAQKEDCITNKFLTVTKGEQEKIQDKKTEKRKDINPEKSPNSARGQKILGEQIYLAIKMKQNKQ